MKKRILVLNYEFPPLGGGASPISYEITKAYVERGYEVDVVTMGFQDLPKYEVKDGISIYRVPCLRFKKEICYPWEQLTFIISAIRFFRIHMKTNSYYFNHTHFLIPTGVISLWLKKKYNLSYIVTSHGSDIPGYNPDRFKTLHKFTRPLLRIIIKNAKGIFAGSNYLANLGNSIGANIKYEVIREGFDPTKFMPQKKKRIILSTGRLLERKGFQYLIKAVSEEDIGYEVHIAGDGPMMDKLVALSRQSKTPIIFHGWLNNSSSAYKDLLESASIYVLASEIENASVSLLEAMSAGCAVITTNVSGCAETVGTAGITVKPRDSEQIKDALQIIIEKEKLYGKKARERVINEYNWNKTVNKYLESFG